VLYIRGPSSFLLRGHYVLFGFCGSEQYVPRCGYHQLSCFL
jgi:hypothetical protein